MRKYRLKRNTPNKGQENQQQDRKQYNYRETCSEIENTKRYNVGQNDSQNKPTLTERIRAMCINKDKDKQGEELPAAEVKATNLSTLTEKHKQNTQSYERRIPNMRQIYESRSRMWLLPKAVSFQM